MKPGSGCEACGGADGAAGVADTASEDSDDDAKDVSAGVEREKHEKNGMVWEKRRGAWLVWLGGRVRARKGKDEEEGMEMR